MRDRLTLSPILPGIKKADFSITNQANYAVAEVLISNIDLYQKKHAIARPERVNLAPSPPGRVA